jgi:hypothetical protein
LDLGKIGDGYENVSEEWQEFRDDFLTRLTERPYIETNWETPVDDILKEMVAEYKGEEAPKEESKDESEDSAIEIIISAALIISEAIKNEIPMKGAIAFGEMTVDKINSLFFGIPLIDAYELHKELKIYGVVLHHSAQKRFNELLGKARIFRSLFTANDSVPMKSGSIEHTLINWMFFVHNPLNLVNKFYYNVSGAPRIYIDNTIKFVRDYLAAMERFRIEAEQQGLLKKTKS